MDTIKNTVLPQTSRQQRVPYRRHPPEFKRQLVLQTLQPGASVARIAQLHQINANQVFCWRKAFREGLLGDEAQPTLLPVTVINAPQVPLSPAFRPATVNISQSHAAILLEHGDARLRIEGRPDADTLRLVLAQWLR